MRVYISKPEGKNPMARSSLVAAVFGVLGLAKRTAWSLGVGAVVMLLPSATYAAKVDICHIPPGNPANFHTITINVNALSAHLAHGDLGGACNAQCATLCNDGDACTIDDTGDCEQVGCPGEPRAPVDCNDGNLCTTDSCDSAVGCVNTVVVCTPPDLCTVSCCAPDTGECVDAPIVCPDGEECDLATGQCVPAGCGGACTVFVTSINLKPQAFTSIPIGIFSGLAGADEVCNTLAAGASLPGTYVAWLSDSSQDAKDRIVDAAYETVGGAPIAANKAALLAASTTPLLNKINVTENGAVLPSTGVNPFVWTGTRADGTHKPHAGLDNHCTTSSGEWTTDNPFQNAQAGNVRLSDGGWTESPSANPCSGNGRLYCFQITP